jgi:penicillin-binding protein 2
LVDADGDPLDNPAINIEFDADGNYIFQPEVIDSADVDREYLEDVAEGLRLVNVFVNDDEFYKGATYVDWLDNFGITTAGKTGTSEYCDNIAIQRGWCRFEDIINRRVLPTHSWYVGYAPFDEPEIVVSVFIFNGGEGSAWAAPIACNVMAAYFEIGQYAEGLDEAAWADALSPANRACNSLTFNPILDSSLFSAPVFQPE